jgi:transposase
MDTILLQGPASDKLASQPGVVKNPNGGYQIHVQLEGRDRLLERAHNAGELMPRGTPELAGMAIFEDCVELSLKSGSTILVHVSTPSVKGSVVYLYHSNGVLWRAVPIERLNPGWVFSVYHFRADLREFDAKLARMRVCVARPPRPTRPTFWTTGGWQTGVVTLPQALVERIREWQHSDLPQPRVALPNAEQVEQFAPDYPPDVQQILAMQTQGVEKVTYQIGGLHLVLSYAERLGLAETINRYCPRQGSLSEGTVITVLVINRLLAPCSLRCIAEWVARTGLHFLLGINDPAELNYDRLADALLAVYPHWQTIAAELTLNAVKNFRLNVETVHYDLTSVFFHGSYEDSDWVTFGYSRDKRPDKPQINIGLSTTADGEVVLPGASGIHAGNVNDGTTTVGVHERLHAIFQRSDLLVTGDRIMQSAENMLCIARAHGRFLGPLDWTPYLRRVVAGCPFDSFETLPLSSQAARGELKATFRHLRFKVKEKLTEAEQAQLADWRKRRKLRGRSPTYREVCFRVRAAILLDTTRQAADAQRRLKAIEAYESKLDWAIEHLNCGRYYGDPEWVEGHLADLAHKFKDVRPFVKVTFTQQEGVMALSYQRRPERIAQAAQLDGKWVLVTNQRPETGQALRDYMDWMVGVYKNHRHVEGRMRNLKSDLPIRPLYLHRDDEIVALCFVSVLALTLYTLIERDCQASPALQAAGVRTAARVLSLLDGFGLTVFLTPSGYEVFWLDTPTSLQVLLWRQLQVDDPGPRLPTVRPKPDPAAFSALDVTYNGFFRLAARPAVERWPALLSKQGGSPGLFWIVNVQVVLYLFCYAENE